MKLIISCGLRFLQYLGEKLRKKPRLKITRIIYPNSEEIRCRDLARSTLSYLRDTDYEKNITIQKYLNGRDMTLPELFKIIPESITHQENREIFDNAYLYNQVGPNNYWIEFNRKRIYTAESNRLAQIIDFLIMKSGESPESFGRGSELVEDLLFEEFKILYPRTIAPDVELFQDDEAYKNHVLKNLRKNFIFFLIPTCCERYEKLIIPLYRMTKPEGKLTDFISGLLHLFKHLQISQKPIAAINRTQKGDTEFYSDVFFMEIFEAFYYLKSEILLKKNESKYSFEFKTSLGKMKKVDFFHNLNADVWFVNSIRSI